MNNDLFALLFFSGTAVVVLLLSMLAYRTSGQMKKTGVVRGLVTFTLLGVYSAFSGLAIMLAYWVYSYGGDEGEYNKLADGIVWMGVYGFVYGGYLAVGGGLFLLIRRLWMGKKGA